MRNERIRKHGIVARHGSPRARRCESAEAAARLAAIASVVWLALVLAARASAADTFDDPFAYCAAVGTIDAPDARYTGPATPPAVARGLQRAFGVAPSEPLAPFERGTSWRCMNGAVWACNVGANLPCLDKPSVDPQPTDGMREYCASNAGADFVPMYVTGHDTLFEWSCDGSTPKRGKQTGQLDARGYVASIWHRIAPPR